MASVICSVSIPVRWIWQPSHATKFCTWYLCLTNTVLVSHIMLPDGVRLSSGLYYFSAFFARAPCVSTEGAPRWHEWGDWVFLGKAIVNMTTALKRTLTHTLTERDLSCNRSLNKEREPWAASWSAGMIQQILAKRKTEKKSKELVYLCVCVFVFASELFEWKPPQRNPMARA